MTVDKETQAVIELTARKTVEHALEQYDEKMDNKVKIHQLTCQATKLGAFKAGTIGVVCCAFTLAGNWLVRKITGG
jgi:predicted metal-dependent hydrolase